MIKKYVFEKEKGGSDTITMKEFVNAINKELGNNKGNYSIGAFGVSIATVLGGLNKNLEKFIAGVNHGKVGVDNFSTSKKIEKPTTDESQKESTEQPKQTTEPKQTATQPFGQ